MGNIYSETVSICSECAKDCPSYYYYEKRRDGVFLNVECREHGLFGEMVERDARFFEEGYEKDYGKPDRHLVLPITYRCNLRCRYCYTLSNAALPMPADRTPREIAGILKDFDGNVTLIGGEPTVREDLAEIIRGAKRAGNGRRVSIGTNARRLDCIRYLEELSTCGLDFVFFSLNDIEYEGSEAVYRTKLKALGNCLNLKVPVWLQRTIDSLRQLDSIIETIETYKKIIFNVTIRAVRPFGIYQPIERIFVSDILKHLGKRNSYTKGTSPFNRHTVLKGKNVKVCSWVNDVRRTDPIDSLYVISNGAMTTLHRGMKMDEVLITSHNPSGHDSSGRIGHVNAGSV